MSEWQKVKIGDVLKRIKRPVVLEDHNEYKLVTVKLHHKGAKLRECKKGCDIGSKMYEVKSEDFILSGIDARNGAFGIVGDDLDGAIVTNDFWYFELNKELIDKHFFLELTSTQWFDDICRLGSDGTTQRIRLQKERFFNQDIYLPSIEKQKEFSERFLLLKAKKQTLNEQNSFQKAHLDLLRQQILRDAITSKLSTDWRAENPDAEPASKLLEQIKAEKEKLIANKKIKKVNPLPPISEGSVPFELPERWKWCRLGNVGLFERGKSKHRPRNDKILFNNGDIPLVQTGDVAQSKKTNYQVNTCKTYYNEIGLKQSRLWSKGTLCITIAANIAETGFLGMDACFPDSVVGFNPLIDEITSKYVQIFIEVSKSNIQEYAPATAQKNINLDIISQLSIPLPPRAEQRAIVAKVERLMGYVSQLQEKIAQNANNAETLMQSFLAEVFKS